MNKGKIKEVLLSIAQSDYESGSVDLHIHTAESDGRIAPVEVIAQAQSKNKKYISITDHNTIEAYLGTNILSNDIVITGVEFDCLHNAIPIHILGYGFDIDNKDIRELMAKEVKERKNKIYRFFHQRKAKDVIQAIHSAGGISILAHPACYWCLHLEQFIETLVNMGLDGVEVYYPYKNFRGLLKFHRKKTVSDFAEKYNLIKTGGSDTHNRCLK